jgi:hypothetical protein
VTFADDNFAPVPRTSSGGVLSSSGGSLSSSGSTNLGDILERVLDKGLVIAGDIRVNLLDIELLTIKLRLVIASLETAKEVGIDWWEHDPWLSGKSSELQLENERLRARIEGLEAGNGQREVIEARRAEPEDVD